MPVYDYSFGMLMPGRSYTPTGGDYRFGFNGKENDNDVMGEGKFQDYGMRNYEPLTCRFISVDPLTRKYPELTPYQFASNRPIAGVDLDGLEFYYSADGTLIGKIGNNIEVKLVDDNDVQKVSFYVYWANNTSKDELLPYITQQANNNSCDVGINNKELMVRAFLGTIRQTEGQGIKLQYNIRYGNGTFDNYDDHPKGTVTKWGKTSSSAGAFEIKTDTWNEVKKQLGLKDFKPESQEIATVQIIKNKSNGQVLDDIKNGIIEESIKKLNKTWTSFPGGKEQGMKKKAALDAFKENVSKELHNNSDLVTPQGKLKVD